MLRQTLGLHSGCTKSNDPAFASTGGHGTAAARSTNTATLAQQPVGRVSELNMQTFQTNTSAAMRVPIPSPDATKKGPSDDDRGHSALDIYNKFMLALSQSMIHALTKAGHYMQIGSRACVDLRTLGDADVEFLEISPAARISTKISCDVRWLISGSLLIFMSEHSLRKLFTMSHLLSASGSSPAIAAGKSLLLSPSGIPGQFCGLERIPKQYSQYRLEKEIKAKITAYHARRGVAVSQDSPWVFVLVATDDPRADHRSPSGEGGKAGLTLWPSQLCLCEDLNGENERSIARAFLGSLDGPNDPLRRAESWFLGKNARAEILEVRRQRGLAEAEKAKQILDDEEEDTLADWQPQNNPDVTPRDVSGIYPTPPDGLPSAFQETSATHDLQLAAKDDEVNTMAMDEEKSEKYDERGNDELFELDTGLYATSGLTEDVWAFFDDPTLNAPGDQVVGDEPFIIERPAEIKAAISPLPEYPALKVRGDERPGSPDSLQIFKRSHVSAGRHGIPIISSTLTAD